MTMNAKRQLLIMNIKRIFNIDLLRNIKKSVNVLINSFFLLFFLFKFLEFDLFL